MAITKAVMKARRKRLLVLADFLEQDVAPRLDGSQFDMEVWGEVRRAGAVPAQIDKTSECGFAGCAVGWAYYCPPLVKAGVRKVVQRDDIAYGNHGDPSRLDVPDENELSEFFGLTRTEKMRCFSPSAYLHRDDSPITVSEVAARLREVAAAESAAGPEAAS